MSTCSKSCDGCDYRGSIGGKGSARTCDYILITGHRRGCPAGSRCAKKRVGGVVVKGIVSDIREDVRAAKTRKPGSGCTSEGARRGWQKRFADPVYQMAQINKWNAMSDSELLKLICDKRLWRQKAEAETQKPEIDVQDFGRGLKIIMDAEEISCTMLSEWAGVGKKRRQRMA